MTPMPLEPRYKSWRVRLAPSRARFRSSRQNLGKAMSKRTGVDRDRATLNSKIRELEPSSTRERRRIVTETSHCWKGKYHAHFWTGEAAWQVMCAAEVTN